MTNARPMTDAFGQAPMFFRSVSLERDIRDPGASRSYVLTGWLERQIERIAEGLEADSTRRAWRMIGDFGVGKSALALALVQALDPRVMSDAMPVRKLLNSRAQKVGRMLPIILTGSANGLAVELSKAIRDALDKQSLILEYQAMRPVASPRFDRMRLAIATSRRTSVSSEVM